MGKTGDFVKKLEIPSEHFMQRWAQYKGRKSMDLTEVKILRGSKNTQHYTRKVLMTSHSKMSGPR